MTKLGKKRAVWVYKMSFYPRWLMMDNTPSALDFLGIEEQDLRACIKRRLSISSLNLVLKAKEKILKKKTKGESRLSMRAGFHRHLLLLSPDAQWGPGNLRHSHSLMGLHVGTVLSGCARQHGQRGYGQCSLPWNLKQEQPSTRQAVLETWRHMTICHSLQGSMDTSSAMICYLQHWTIFW